MREDRTFYAPEQIGSWRTLALGAGGVFTIIWLVGLFFNPEQALRSWILGFIFWAGNGIGRLGVLLLQYLTGGAWGVVIRRTLEAGMRTLPVIVILFLPLAIGINQLYEWTHLPDDRIIQHRGWYMTVGGWIARSVVYFILWGVMVYLLDKWSREQDAANSPEEAMDLLNKASRFSGPTLVIYVLVVTFASVDWMMTLEPHWFSTIWGFLFAAGWALSCYCFVVAIMAWMADKPPMDRILGKRHFHDIGKLMLALVMVWAYFNFSQYLIIWAGNLPEETAWYIARMKGTWGVIGLLLLFFHFAFPFLVLLQQDFKRKAGWLAKLAIFILVMRLIDMYYLIGPSPRIVEHGRLDFLANFSWMDIAAPIAVGGIWLWWFFGELMKRPLVPINDPYLENAIGHGKGH
ncbi:MAG TPA: hypothetical protein VK892_05150 [Pyrinomonadaceae bacterium]|nr:hypothetical protein [Pyrinomonadaceae bacterium]